MRKRNNPIRMITVRSAPPRRRLVVALAQRFGIVADARRAAEAAPNFPGGEPPFDGVDLDQRVRASGEW